MVNAMYTEQTVSHSNNTSKAKHIFTALLCVCLMGALLFSLTACSLFYDFEHVDCFGIGYSKREKNAFISSCRWDGDRDNMTFIIPDDYNGIKIRDLGGYFGRGVPCPFGISVNTEEVTFVSSETFGDDDYESLVFTVVLGKSISNVKYVVGKNYFGTNTQNENGEYISDTLYKVVYYFEVSPENPTFYSENGKLYNKSDGSLIDEFFYE